MKLKGKTALVSGGAGMIGRAIALRFADEGANVAVLDINADAVGKVAEEIRGRGVLALGCPVDVRDYTAVKACVDAAAEALGGIDIVVNAAGGSARKRMDLFERIDIGVVDDVVDINLRGTLYVIHAALPHLIRRNRQDRQPRVDRSPGRLCKMLRLRGGEGRDPRGDPFAGDRAGPAQHQRQRSLPRTGPAARRDACRPGGLRAPPLVYEPHLHEGGRGPRGPVPRVVRGRLRDRAELRGRRWTKPWSTG